MTRRARTITTLAVLGALALAGCGSSYNSPDSGNPSPTTPATSPATTPQTTAPQSAGAGYAGY